MRKINLIVIHCSDSDIDGHDDIGVIKKWHLERGWKNIGYHYFIKKDGSIQLGRNDSESGAHVEGYNATSIGVCFSGKKNFTNFQFYSCLRLVKGLLGIYGLSEKDIVPHNVLNANGKTCPNFDVSEIFKSS